MATDLKPDIMAPKLREPVLEELLYIDGDGLQGLFAQTGSMTPSNVTREANETDATAGKLTPNIGFSLLGIKIGGSFESSSSRTQGDKVVEEAEWRPENQLAVIRLSLKQAGRLHSDLYGATNEAKTKMGTAFCDFTGVFRPFGWNELDSDSWRRRANEDKSLLLELDDDPTTKVGMSFSKIVFGAPLEQISPSGHLALRLRRSVGLRILGTVDSGRYIKPYAAAFV